jgi:cysteinyl-tRNA synthetase
MKLFNTRTHRMEEFRPQSGNVARIYTCGPTVYNYAHIGNLFAYIFADMLRRAVNLAGYETKHVMNLTDVDDKTVRDSRVSYPDLPPEIALEKLTRHYEKIFRDEMTQIGNDISAVEFVRATENIAEMQKLIRDLLDEGIAYTADDGIYFNIAEYQKTRKYGQLSKIEPPRDRQARIDNDQYDKDSAQDFALWKAEKPGEPAWDFLLAEPQLTSARLSQDGKSVSDEPRNDVREKRRGSDVVAEVATVNFRGRPGWHIECSAMSVQNLGQPFDIHTGGIDLIFPHHENEIAQSTAGDQPELYANFFVHNGHLLVDGAKMAKSAGNFYTLPDIIKKGFGPLDFRMLVLQSHYRSNLNFSWDSLAAARNRLAVWRNAAELRWQVPDVADDGQFEIMDNLREKASRALTDDLNTPVALKHLDQAINVVTSQPNNVNHFALTALFDFTHLYLGIDVLGETPDITDQQKRLIEERTAARRDKNWAKSDEMRAALNQQGIELNDTADRTIWSRK